MNSNLFHNIANAVSAALAAATAFLLAYGCVSTAAGTIDCSASSLNPAWTAIAISAIQVAKLGVNIVRDGFGGLVKQQPPVE